MHEFPRDIARSLTMVATSAPCKLPSRQLFRLVCYMRWPLRASWLITPPYVAILHMDRLRQTVQTAKSNAMYLSSKPFQGYHHLAVRPSIHIFPCRLFADCKQNPPQAAPSTHPRRHSSASLDMFSSVSACRIGGRAVAGCAPPAASKSISSRPRMARSLFV